MKITKQYEIISSLNDLGAICSVKLHGIQYQFKFDLTDLSPTSPIYKSSRPHIADTIYTLIPTESARTLVSIGRRIWKDLVEFTPDSQRLDCDYVKTDFGRFVRRTSFRRMDRLMSGLEEEMRSKALELFGSEYENFYRNGFVHALSFFAKDNSELRELINLYKDSLELFWEDINKLQEELRKLEKEIQLNDPCRGISIKEVDDPRIKALLKFRSIPQSVQEYRDLIGYSYQKLGFHPDSLPAPGLLMFQLTPLTLEDVWAYFREPIADNSVSGRSRDAE